MTQFANVNELYVDSWGEPSHEALFRARDGIDIRVMKWSEDVTGEGVTLYWTSGASDIELPGMDPRHRQEFSVGFDPECDEVAESLAQVGMYAARSGKVLGDGHIYRADGPLWSESELVGYVVATEDSLGYVDLSDGRHVEFLMLVPAFREELDFAARLGVGALIKAQERANIAFWDPFRKKVPLIGPPCGDQG